MSGCGAEINYEEIKSVKPGVRVTSVEGVTPLASVLILKAINTNTEGDFPRCCRESGDNCAGKGLSRAL